MDNNKELAELRKQLRKEKAKNGMPLKKKLIYGGAIGGATVVAAVAIGLSVGKDDYKDHVVFDNGQRFDTKQLVGGKTQQLINFNMDNKILTGDKIMAAAKAAGVSSWGGSERLVEVSNDPVKAAFEGSDDVYVYYFSDTTTLNPSVSQPSLGQAFDTPDEIGITDPETGEVTTPNLKPDDLKYKGVIPDNYDSAGKRYGNTKVFDGLDSFKQVGEFTHKVSFDIHTGKIIGISDKNGNKVSAGDIAKIKPVVSSKKIDVMDADGNVSSEYISYAEAASKMESVIQQLGDIRGVTSRKDQFELFTGNNIDIYAANIAGIVDIPSYISLQVDKEAGNKLKYHLLFDKSIFPNFNEEFGFEHEIVLYQQPGGAMKIMDDAVKHFNKDLTLKTYDGVWNNEKLETTGYQEVDLTDKGNGAINFSDLLALTGLTSKELNFGFYQKQLPSLKLEYRVVDDLYEDGLTHIQLRPKFKTYFSKIMSKPIAVNVTGITQAIVDKEQERINADKETFDMKVDARDLAEVVGVDLTPDLEKKYGLEDLLDPKFAYKLTHPEVTSDGTVKMSLDVSKDGIKSQIKPTGLDLDVRGIDAANALIKEQEFFNKLTPTLKVDDIKYPRADHKKLSQADLKALGIDHKIDLLKYEYYLDNDEANNNGHCRMKITVKPLAVQRTIVSSSYFNMDFSGITEANDVLKEQNRLDGLSDVSANIDKTSLPEAKDAKLTTSLAHELGLDSIITPDFTYTYSHKGINGDAKIDVTILVSKAGTTYHSQPTTISVDVTGIDRAIAIEGQQREQDEVNKLASTTHQLHIDALTAPAKNLILKDTADFDALGLTHKAKPGYVYELTAPQVTKDGDVEYKITVRVAKSGSFDVDTSIDALSNINPIMFAVSGIDDAVKLKDEQEKVNSALSSSISATLSAKDLLHATVDDTDPVEFASYDGVLTQNIIDTLGLGITLNPKYGYHIKYGQALADDPKFKVEVDVTKTGVTNYATPATGVGTINLQGINDVKDKLGLDKEQNVVNKIAASTKHLRVDANSLAAVLAGPLDAKLLAALGITKTSKYDYKVNHGEMTSDGEMDCTVTLYLKTDPTTPPKVTPATFKVEVTGIEDFKMTQEQDDVNHATASYEVPDGDLENLDASAAPLSFPAVAKTPLTTTDITKYGIKDKNGNVFVMKPQYSYEYEFATINSDGGAKMIITVSGKSTYKATDLASTTNPGGFAFTITGFARAQAEKDLT